MNEQLTLRDVRQSHAKCTEKLDDLIGSLQEFNQSATSNQKFISARSIGPVAERDISSYLRSIDKITIPRILLDIVTFGLFSEHIYK